MAPGPSFLSAEDGDAEAQPRVTVTNSQALNQEFELDVFLGNNQPEETTTRPGAAARDERSVSPSAPPPPSPSPVSSPHGRAAAHASSLLPSPPLQLPENSLADLRRVSSQSRFSRRRIKISPWQPRVYSHWKSPILMVLFYTIGLTLSIAHCVVYHNLDGKVVGSSYDQEQNLRYGTAFSFIAQLALTASSWAAYTQWLWRTVQRTQWTVNGLNNVFGADTAPSSLISLEFLRKFPLGATMAFFAWCLVLPPFFTPATLFVYQSEEAVQVQQPIPYLSIAHAEAGNRYAYSPPMNKSTVQFIDDFSKTFCGPRTILTLLSTATASRGEILPIKAPYNHSSYDVQFHGPVVRCSDANSSTTQLINRALGVKASKPLGTAYLDEAAYYGFVPAHDEDNQFVAMDQPRYQGQPSNASNELWMFFQRYTEDGGDDFNRTHQYQVCRLHNATYNVSLSWDSGFQHVNASYEVNEEVLFPHDKLGDVSNYAQHAYSAFMWSLTDQLVGLFAWFIDRDPNLYRPAQFGAINSPIQHNSLLGSSDLDVFFNIEVLKGLYLNNPETPGNLSDQRLQDKGLAKNRTLDVSEQDLSSVSLF